MPSISEITVNGSGNARSAIRSISPVAARDDLVERLVDQPLDLGPQRLDHLRRERLRHEPAQPVVVGRVEVEDRPLTRGCVVTED